MNKYLITVIVPIVEAEYELFIPNNKKVGTIKKSILGALSELTSGAFKKDMSEVRFLDRDTGLEFDNNMYIKDSGIKNGSKIIIM